MTTNFDAWVGREEERSERIDAAAVQAPGRDARPRPHRPPVQPLPPGWQWLFFNPRPRRAARWAPMAIRSAAVFCRRSSCRAACGRAVAFAISPIVPVECAGDAPQSHPQGREQDRQAWLAVVRDRPTHHQRDGTPCIVEEQDIVYREAHAAGRSCSHARSATTACAQWSRSRRTRHDAPVSLLGADLQRPPHPLRPGLRDAMRRVIRTWWCTARSPPRCCSSSRWSTAVVVALARFDFRGVTSAVCRAAPSSSKAGEPKTARSPCGRVDPTASWRCRRTAAFR